MANRDLLKEAIADAKAVKEVAIANAKAALEEAFTPHLKNMLAERINEMDDLEELDLSEVDKMKKKAQTKMKEGNTMNKVDEKYGSDIDEELNLEEILAELELEEDDYEEGMENMEEMKNMDEMKDIDEMDYMQEEEAEEEINLEDMSEEELKSFIEDVIEDMIEDGELVPGPNADESEDEEDMEMDGAEDEDVDIDVDLQEGKEKRKKDEEVNEALGVEAALPILAQGIAAIGGTAAAIQALEKYAEKNPNTVIGKVIKGIQKVTAGSTSATNITAGTTSKLEETIKYLRSELNEVNLLNSKLLYTNKIFRNKSLTENQKIKVLKAFDKAETVKEAKAIFETLNENLVAKSTKSNIRESMGMASKPAGVAPKRELNEGIVQEDAMVARFKKLAGIK